MYGGLAASGEIWIMIKIRDIISISELDYLSLTQQGKVR